MDTTRLQKQKLGFYFLVLVMLICGLLMCIHYIFFPSSLGRISDDTIAWDGSIASSFAGGNGTDENPYLIGNGSELAYFKNLIENDTDGIYKNKSYALNHDIDLNNLEFDSIGEEKLVDDENIYYGFEGTFNGNGYTIGNAKLTSSVVNNESYYGFFATLNSAKIYDLNIENFDIVDHTENTVNAGILAGTTVNSDISYLTIIDSDIEVSAENSKIGELTSSLTNTKVYLTFLNGNIKSTNAGSISHTENAENPDNSISFVVTNIKLNNEYLNNNFVTSENTYSNLYYYTKNADNELIITDGNNNLTIDEVTSLLNSKSENFTWQLYNENLVYEKVPDMQISMYEQISTLANNNTTIIEHPTGIEGDTVYVNDLEADYNYYYGRNYTDSSDGTIPTPENKNIYTENTLVRVFMKYNGTGYSDSTQVGYVSTTERQSSYIYYKYYYVNSDYLYITLIDNPFIDRPTNKGFNGWVTTYQGAEIIYHDDNYTREIKIPVSYTNNKPDDIMIELNASWVDASVGELTTNSNSGWNNAFSNLNLKGMQEIEATIQSYGDLSNYYTKETIYFFQSYPDDAVDYYGDSYSGICFVYGGCDYYSLNSSGEYSSSEAYYELTIRGMTRYYPTLSIIPNPAMGENGNVAGLFKEVTLTNGNSLEGYYNDSGEIQTTGTCNSNTCTYYEYQQYYNSDGTVNTSDDDYNYYYLVTRDTNFIILETNISTAWSKNNVNSKPFTLTSVYNGEDYTDHYLNVSNLSLHCYADLTVEYLYLYSQQSSGTNGDITNSTSATKHLYGDFNNLKIGRGIKRNGTYVALIGMLGGSNATIGSTSNYIKYRIIIESGYYTYASIYQGAITTVNTYAYGSAIVGSDYDRVTNNNENLNFTSGITGSFGGNNYSPGGTLGTLFTITVKSGSFGSRQADNTAGFYTGQRSKGNATGLCETIIEGGWFYVINGGPQFAATMEGLNSISIYIKGGEIGTIFGGAGKYSTYGNRIIQMTGGKIKYSLFGGSNAYGDTANAGTLYSDSYVYVGGNAQIGGTTGLTQNISWGSLGQGNVFGNGNGKNGATTVGSNDNATIIIDGDAVIAGNIYGGANYGQAGCTSSTKQTDILINILDGTIKGSVYGGGNNNGVGSTSVNADVTINIYGGNIEGSVFGGSKTKGIIYGNAELNVLTGTINGSVYGAGEGGSTNSNGGTYLEKNIVVNIGDEDNSPIIKNNVYGGSAYGNVNVSAYADITKTSAFTTTVNIKNGTITKSVFGGSQGSSSYKPANTGPITVNITGGSMGDVYGSSDQYGVPINTIVVNQDGGTTGNIYGGGNKTGATDTTVNLNSGTALYAFGGSNQSGTVENSKINYNGSNITYLFGGNNAGGTTTNSDVELNSDFTTAYGGNNLGGTTENALINLNGVTLNEIYGGGYGSKANTTKSTVNLFSGTVTNVYGGGNQAATGESEVNLINANTTKVFGGGNQAGATKTVVNTTGGTVSEVYGGSNSSGIVGNSNINVNYGNNSNDIGIDISYTETPVTWQSSLYTNYLTLTVTLKNNTAYDLSEYSGSFILPNSVIYQNYSQVNLTESNGTYSFNQNNRYYGTNTVSAGGTYSFSVNLLTNSSGKDIDFQAVLNGKINGEQIDYSKYNIMNIYGGNNLGGQTTQSHVNILNGGVQNVFGGGNEAITADTNVLMTGGVANLIYGGGNNAETINNTNVEISGGIVKNDVYGGGNLGNVKGSTNVKLTDANISSSAYGGGRSADVLTSSTINVEGTTQIGENLFAGGNLGAIGTAATDNATSTVNLVGGNIGKNVYGGCNTSVVYGLTYTNIGLSASSNQNLTMDNIKVAGTVFGGGEANASGSENYDYSFISVTKGIDIQINGDNYLENNYSFLMEGSIFGSGNASSSSGTSNIYVKDLGTQANPSLNVSIQRADTVTLDNSVMELVGATDRTNEYSTIKYSINRVDTLKLKNNAVLMVQQNANLLKSFYSLVDINGEEVKASVVIDDENGTVTRNTNNRLYVLANKNLNITTNEAATSYGVVSGMTFFGMYTKYSNGSYQYGLYDKSFDYGTEADAGDVIIGGSYVLGLHSLNHDITIDGFYSNYIDDAYTTVTAAYIDPTPPDANYYMWAIGIQAINYEFSLTASKYSSLGTYELALRDFSAGDTIFQVLGFNSEGLTSGITLKDSNEVPKLTSDASIANSIIGLSMKSETTEWTSYGTTKFMSNGNGIYSGTTEYKTDSQSMAPSLMFYLYHAKNISLDQDLGNVVITLQAMTPINEIEYQVDLITITVNISARSYDDGDAYDASITYSKKYEMPSSTSVNITNKSQFTSYFSVYTTVDSLEAFYGNNNDYYHAIVSSVAFPVGTKLTMLDYGADEINPEYYYYTINTTDYNNSLKELQSNGEVSYKLSKFIKMGSTSTDNTYNDAEANELYYDETTGSILEEFIIIVDMQDTTWETTSYDNSILFELRNNEDRSIISVLGPRQSYMKFSLYQTSNIALEQDITMTSEYLYNNTNVTVPYAANVAYNQTENREQVIDTNYEASNMGLNITLIDSSNTQVTSSLLEDTTISIDNVLYHADSNGVFRIKLAGKVSNLIKNIYLHVGNTVPTGSYTLKYKLFASDDGLYSNGTRETIRDFNMTLLGNDNAIVVNNNSDEMQIVKPDEKTNNKLSYTLNYYSALMDPNIRISVYKRNTDTSITDEYTELDSAEVFENTFVMPSFYGYNAQSNFEKMLTKTPSSIMNYNYSLLNTLSSGTYKIVFKLYNKNDCVDTIDKYFIVKKHIE